MSGKSPELRSAGLTPIYVDGERLVADQAEFEALPLEVRQEIEAADDAEIREKIAAFNAHEQHLRSIIGPSYWD